MNCECTLLWAELCSNSREKDLLIQLLRFFLKLSITFPLWFYREFQSFFAEICHLIYHLYSIKTWNWEENKTISWKTLQRSSQLRNCRFFSTRGLFSICMVISSMEINPMRTFNKRDLCTCVFPTWNFFEFDVILLMKWAICPHSLRQSFPSPISREQTTWRPVLSSAFIWDLWSHFLLSESANQIFH